MANVSNETLKLFCIADARNDPDLLDIVLEKKGFGLEVRFTRSILVHQSQISYVQLSFCVLIYHWGERHVLADIRFTDLNCQFSISWLGVC